MKPTERNSENQTPSTEGLTRVFVWIAGGAVLFGGMPYLYPSSST